MKKSASLRVWLNRYWIGVILFCVVVYGLLQPAFLARLTEKVEKNLQQNVKTAQNYIDDSLGMVDNFIYEAFSNSMSTPYVQPLYQMKYGDDALDILAAERTITILLQNLVTWSDMVDGIIFYMNARDNLVWLEAGTSENYQLRKELKTYMGDVFKGEAEYELQRYMIFSATDGNHMIRNMKIGDCYFIVCVSESKVLQAIQSAEYHKNSIAFAADEKGNVIFSSIPMDVSIVPEGEGTYISVSGKEYLQTGFISGRNGYYFGILTSAESIAEELLEFRISFFILFLGLLFFVPISIYAIHRMFEKPLAKMLEAMGQVEEGDFNVTVKEPSLIDEFGQLTNTFNHMIGKIQKLKIENYEMQLRVQKTAVQYLMLQINPHFYANTMNILYSLAETKDYEKIQKIAVAAGKYSRYMFHDAMELVELHRELSHVRDYMTMQHIRYGGRVLCIEEIPDALQGALIPPFLIQSFVENSVKYAFNTKSTCTIEISVQRDEKTDDLKITIRDNGKGYNQEVLERSWEDKDAEGHIGLTNVYTRMCLIYGERANIQLYNDHGAVSILTVPYIATENDEAEQEEEDETV